MSYLQWNESLSTKIELIDTQHKELIARLNKLHEAMKQRAGKQEVRETLKFLESYVVQHFSDEEKILEHQTSPYKLANKKAHQEFIARLKKLKEDELSQSLFVALKVYNELSNWVVDHILNIDKKLAES